jgi:nitrate/TMAO reductase-like tetraheme cytochrome c subunit
MHPVNDSRWTNGGHGNLAEDNQQACATCHGTSFRGTTLSRTAAQRTWRTGSRTRSVSKGQEVGCYDCHNGPGGGDD